jgi:hypothetical protein
MNSRQIKVAIPQSLRLSMLQVSHLCGQPFGRLRADPTFPPMYHGTFDEAAVLAWKAARDSKQTSQEK